jgi:hypothetical protein
MIIVITDWFPVYHQGRDTGKKEFGVSHGIEESTGKIIPLPQVSPNKIGAKWNLQLMEWVLEDDE